MGKYRQKDAWTYISNVDALELKEVIAPLVSDMTSELGAKKFDILMLNIQLSMVSEDVNAERCKVKVFEIAQHLQEKASISQIASKMSVILEVSKPEFWEDATLDRLEYVRKEMRDLVQFILGTSNRTFTLDIEDAVEILDNPSGIVPRLSYKQRVIDYLAKNKNLPVLQKIFRMEQLEHKDILQLERICWEELGTKEEYIKTIITYVCENGDISLPTLVNDSPFCDFNWVDVFGQNMISVRKFVEDVHGLIA